MIDKKLTYKTRVSREPNFRSVGILFKVSPFLNSNSLASLDFVLTHLYINHINITTVITNKTYLEIIPGKQKQTAGILCSHNGGF